MNVGKLKKFIYDMDDDIKIYFDNEDQSLVFSCHDKNILLHVPRYCDKCRNTGVIEKSIYCECHDGILKHEN